MEKIQSLREREASDFEGRCLLIAAAVARREGLYHPLLRQGPYSRHSLLFVRVHKLKVLLTQQARYDGHQFILFVEDVQMISLGRDVRRFCSSIRAKFVFFYELAAA